MKGLVDTSIWLNHLRSPDSALKFLLEEGDVLIHEDLLGELACGNLRNRRAFLSALALLPITTRVPASEVLEFIDREELFEKGLGWTDCQLLAAARVSRVKLYTADKALLRQAEAFGCAFDRGSAS